MKTGSFVYLMLRAQRFMVQRRVRALGDQSVLMLSVIATFVIGYWIVGYLLFRAGFVHLTQFPGLGGMLMDRMLYLFFAFLFMMLVFSNMIIGYSSLFKNPETQWMLTLPVPHADVFRWKLAETMVLASWAFLFLAAPFLLAYGVVRNVDSWFYFKAFVLFLPFIMIPAALGLLAILIVTRFMHRRVFKWALFGFGGLGLLLAIFFLKPIDVSQVNQTEMISVMDQLMRSSRITVQPLLPSYWVAASVIAWGEGWGGRGLFFFSVLLSNALMGLLLCVGASRRFFYDGWSRNQSQGGSDMQAGLLLCGASMHEVGLVQRILQSCPWLHPATRALMLKDIKVFWRDTSQWSQFVIFFGLLGLYVLNLRNVSYKWNSESWAGFVSFLNLGACSMTLATLTTRFVFPQFSMEGRRLWLVGMVPHGIQRVVMQKFWLSSAGSIAITLPLTLLSSRMLYLPLWMTVFFSATIILMSFSLCAIAVGVGALFPNFGTGSTANRYDNPAKIVSGFGGTFCFLLSLVYIGLVIGLEVAPFYLRFGPWIGLDRSVLLAISWGLVTLVSLGAILLPLLLALRTAEQMEM